MQITWHGSNCIRLQGKEATIVVDPLTEASGLKNPKWSPDMVVSSSEEVAKVKTAPSAFHITTPGEYELKEAFVYGIEWKQTKGKGKTILFRINLDGISIACLGGIDGVLESKQLEILEGCDIVILPAGNKEALTVKEAVENVARIEPRIVIPVDVKAKGIKLKRETPEAFIKELGVKGESVDKLKIVKKDLPVDQRLVYLLDLA